MFKMILSAVVALGFTIAAHAQEGAPAPTKMEGAPAMDAPAAAPAAEGDKTAAKKKHHKKGKKKNADEAPKAE